jgi:hypothetical protein
VRLWRSTYGRQVLSNYFIQCRRKPVEEVGQKGPGDVYFISLGDVSGDEVFVMLGDCIYFCWDHKFELQTGGVSCDETYRPRRTVSFHEPRLNAAYSPWYHIYIFPLCFCCAWGYWHGTSLSRSLCCNVFYCYKRVFTFLVRLAVGRARHNACCGLKKRSFSLNWGPQWRAGREHCSLYPHTSNLGLLKFCVERLP